MFCGNQERANCTCVCKELAALVLRRSGRATFAVCALCSELRKTRAILATNMHRASLPREAKGALAALLRRQLYAVALLQTEGTVHEF